MWQPSQQSSAKPQDSYNRKLPEPSQPPKDHKHRDYLKQQQRLKAMPLSSSKVHDTIYLLFHLVTFEEETEYYFKSSTLLTLCFYGFCNIFIGNEC